MFLDSGRHRDVLRNQLRPAVRTERHGLSSSGSCLQRDNGRPQTAHQTVKQITYLLTPWSWVLLEKLTGFQLVKKVPAFYGTKSFITAFKSAHHLSSGSCLQRDNGRPQTAHQTIKQITYLLTPRSWVLLEKLTGFQLVKKVPAFYGTRSFITAFKSAHHLSLSWASSIQSIPHVPFSEDPS